MSLLKKNYNRSIEFALLLSISCFAFSLNAGRGDQEKGNEETILGSRSPALAHFRVSSPQNMSQSPENPEEIDYDDLFLKYGENTISHIPYEIVEKAFAQPNIKEKIITKIGYLPAGLLICPHIIYGLCQDWLEKTTAAAYNNNAIAQLNLAWLDTTGFNGFSRNDEAAFHCFVAADRTNIRFAQYMIGRMLLDGRGCPQNIAEGQKFLWAAAQNGLPRAQYDLSRLLTKSRTPLLDKIPGVNWLSLAARNGLGIAQYRLAKEFVRYGQDKEGCLLLAQAAENKCPQAQYALAKYLYHHQDTQNAYYWLHEAAKNRHTLSQKTVRYLDSLPGHIKTEVKSIFQGWQDFYEFRDIIRIKETMLGDRDRSEHSEEFCELYTNLDEQRMCHKHFVDIYDVEHLEIDKHLQLKTLREDHQKLSRFEKSMLKVLDCIADANPGLMTSLPPLLPEGIIKHQSNPYVAFQNTGANGFSYYTYGEHNCSLVKRLIPAIRGLEGEGPANAERAFDRIKNYFNNPTTANTLKNIWCFKLSSCHASYAPGTLDAEEKRILSLKQKLYNNIAKFSELKEKEKYEAMQHIMEKKINKYQRQHQLLCDTIIKITTFLSPEAAQKRSEEFSQYLGLAAEVPFVFMEE